MHTQLLLATIILSPLNFQLPHFLACPSPFCVPPLRLRVIFSVSQFLCKSYICSLSSIFSTLPKGFVLNLHPLDHEQCTLLEQWPPSSTNPIPYTPNICIGKTHHHEFSNRSSYLDNLMVEKSFI